MIDEWHFDLGKTQVNSGQGGCQKPRGYRRFCRPVSLAFSCSSPLSRSDRGRLFALCALALDCGVRQGEVLALTWSDVELDEGNIRISKNLQELKCKLKVKATKTKGSRRGAPVYRKLLEVVPF